MKSKKMLRKLIFSLALGIGLALGTAAVCSFADKATVGDIEYTYTVSNNNATITAVDHKPSGNYTIPSELGGKTVTAIADSQTYSSGGVFYESTITSLRIPDSVTEIGKYAFSDCANLASVTFENTQGT